GREWSDPRSVWTPDQPLVEEAVFVWLDRMRLQFDDGLACQRKDPVQTADRLDGCQREKEVDNAVAPGQQAVHPSAVETIAEVLLPGLKREVSPNDRAGGKKSSQQHVGAEVHVMMAIHPLRRYPVQAEELIPLGRDDIVEGTSKPRMKDHRGQSVPQEVPRQFALSFDESGWTRPHGKRRRQVQMQTDVDATRASQVGRPGPAMASTSFRYRCFITSQRIGAYSTLACAARRSRNPGSP